MKKTIKFKLIKIIFTVFLLIPCLFAFSSCKNCNANIDISISSDGYWVINGEKTNTKAKGEDGKDGIDSSDFTIREIYDELLLDGYSGTFSDFIKEYFDLSMNLSAEIAQECKSSIVSISVNNGSKNGSGIVIKKDNQGTAYILTNNHVVNPNASTNSIKLYLADDDKKQNTITASFITKNETYDLALLKVENSETINNATVATFASKNASVGESCLAIGNTHSKGIAVTFGNVSKSLEEVSYTSGGRKYQVLRHCAYIEKGSSGGGLFNLAGELIGVTNAGEDGDTTLMNYAIPIEHITEFVNEVINNL